MSGGGMKHTKLKKALLGTAFGAGLAAGVSFYPLMRNMVRSHTADFDKIQVVVGKDTLSKQDFYDRLTYRDGAWRLPRADGTMVNIDSLADFRTGDAKRHEWFLERKLINTVDTVYVRYAQFVENPGVSDIVFGMGANDSLGYLPTLGRYSYDRLNLRYFKADNDELQKIVDVYNDAYNCTHRHEYQHYLNAVSGIGRAGQSYENKFVECCLDEVSANIAQLLEQRKHYLENGNDLSFITGRFSFYKKALEQKKIKPTVDGLTEEEIRFIGNGVFDTWMEKKFNMYVRGNTSRTVHILSKTNYNGVQPDSLRHRRLLEKMFVINGIDFYPSIAGREGEVRQRIPAERLKYFRFLKKEKYQQMGYIEKLEKERIEKGEHNYNISMAKNKMWAEMKRWFDKGNKER